MLKFSGFLISGTAPHGVTTSVRSRGTSPPLMKLCRLLHPVSSSARANRHRTAARRIPSSYGRADRTRPAGDRRQLAYRVSSGRREGSVSLEYLVTRIGQLLLIVFIAVTVNFLIPRAIP